MSVSNTFKCLSCGKIFPKDPISNINRGFCLKCGGSNEIIAQSLYLFEDPDRIRTTNNIDLKECIRFKYHSQNIDYINELNSRLIFPNGISQTYAR